MDYGWNLGLDPGGARSCEFKTAECMHSYIDKIYRDSIQFTSKSHP